MLWIYNLDQADDWFRPFKNQDDLLAKADDAWQLTNEKDWLEAFSHHPKIGDLKSLEQKFASTKVFAEGEQSSLNSAEKKNS
jgi:2-oxo-4-hydroxy-4-carboxy-5-ureidoimidazoline decarboxylase